MKSKIAQERGKRCKDRYRQAQVCSSVLPRIHEHAKAEAGQQIEEKTNVGAFATEGDFKWLICSHGLTACSTRHLPLIFITMLVH